MFQDIKFRVHVIIWAFWATFFQNFGQILFNVLVTLLVQKTFTTFIDALS